MNSKLTRCFIALLLPDDIKEFAYATQQAIKNKEFVDARYTQKDALHLTLKFLGEINNSQIKKVSDKLKNIKFRKFKVALESTGAFFQDGDTKIIWHALGGEELNLFQKTIDDSLKELFSPENRFMAHVTIARVKKDFDQKELLNFLSLVKPAGKSYEVDKFCLIKSTQTKDGSVYEILEEYKLFE